MTSLLTPLQQLFHRPKDQDHAASSAEARAYARIRRLPRRAQQVLVLSRVDDLPYAGICQRLSIAVGELESDMVRALLATRDATPLPAESRASEWYIKLQSPQTTASERIDFRRWLDAQPANLAAFHETELHWRRLLAPARLVAARAPHPRRHHPLQIGAWLTGLLSMILLMVLAF